MKKVENTDSKTVAEFIEILKQFPQDLPVRISCSKEFEVKVSKEFYDGDSANPKCSIIEAVLID